jgi:hypothetical protein
MDIKKLRGIIFIVVATFLSMVEGDDLQDTNCKGKTNHSFHYNKLLYWNLKKRNGHSL